MHRKLQSAELEAKSEQKQHLYASSGRKWICTLKRWYEEKFAHNRTHGKTVNDRNEIVYRLRELTKVGRE